jgi:hypothetical protein
VRGANAIIALRCCRFSGKFEDYWETRSTAASSRSPTFMSHTPKPPPGIQEKEGGSVSPPLDAKPTIFGVG